LLYHIEGAGYFSFSSVKTSSCVVELRGEFISLSIFCFQKAQEHKGDIMWAPSHFDKERVEDMTRGLIISASRVHPDPRLYKYYWWVYHAEMDEADASKVFWEEKYRMCEKTYRDLIEMLRKDGSGYVIANQRFYRLGASLWDYERLKMKEPDIWFAPAFDDDPDPLVHGRR